MTEDIFIEIKKHILSPEKYTATQIRYLVNEYLIRQNRKPISLSSVYKVISMVDEKSEARIARFEEKYDINKMMLHAQFMPPPVHEHFIPPQVEGSLWIIDGARILFSYKDGQKYNNLTYYVVLDAYSKKVVGFSINESKIKKIAIDALSDACKNSGYLPREIVIDNSMVFMTREFNNIVAQIEEWGVSQRFISRNARDNAYIEKLLCVFQEYICKKYEGYIGNKGIGGRLNERNLTEVIKYKFSVKEPRTKSELIELIANLIKEYNELKVVKEYTGSDDLVIKQIQDKTKEPFDLDDAMFSKLFREQKGSSANKILRK